MNTGTAAPIAAPIAAPTAVPIAVPIAASPTPRARGRVARLGIVAALVLAFSMPGADQASAAPFPAWPFPDCKAPPMPSPPDIGIPGSVDLDASRGPSTPIEGRDPYGTYGYGGIYWSTYDLGCLGGMADPGATLDTSIANLVFGAAKSTFAVQMAMTNLVHDNTVNNAVTDAASDSSRTLYDAVFSPWAGAALVIAAAAMLIASKRGDVGKVLTRATLTLVAVAISALSFGSGGQLSRDLSGTVRAAMDDVSSAVARAGFPGVSTNTSSAPATDMRNVLFRELLWKAWADGQVGDRSGPGEDLAWALYQQQAFTKDEAAALRTASREAQIVLYQAKGEAWQKVADAAPPNAYQAIQGKAHNRTGVAIMVLLKILPISLLQIFGMLILALMYGFLALLPVGAPLLGLLAIVFPGAPEKTIKVVGAVISGGIIAGICTLVHTLIVLKLAQGDLNSWATILWVWVTAIIMFALLKPIVSLTAILGSVLTSPGRVAARNARQGLRVGAWLKGELRHRRASRLQHETLDALRGRRPDGGTAPPPPDGPHGGGGPFGGGGGGGSGPRPDSGPSGGGGGGTTDRTWRDVAERPGGTAGSALSAAVAAASATTRPLTTDDDARGTRPSTFAPDTAPHRTRRVTAGDPRSAGQRAARGPGDTAPSAPAPGTFYRPGAGSHLRPAQRVDTTDSGTPVYRITGLYRPPAHRARPAPPTRTAPAAEQWPLRRPERPRSAW